MKIKNDLKKKIEKILLSWPGTDEEFGGFFFKNRNGVLSDFLLIPNISDSKKDTYRMAPYAKALADKYARAMRLTLEAHWHNHPDPCVLSVQDCRAAESWKPLYSVMISPTEKHYKEFIWYAYKGIKPEKIEFV